MKRYPTLLLLPLALLLGACGLVRVTEETALLSLATPRREGDTARGAVRLRPVPVPEGAYRVEVVGRSTPGGPLWLTLLSSPPPSCAPAEDGELAYCESLPETPFLVLLGEEERRGEAYLRSLFPERPRFLYLAVGWPSGTSWRGTVGVVVRYESF